MSLKSLILFCSFIVLMNSCQKEDIITSQKKLNGTSFSRVKTVDTYKITYKSDGLFIEGFVAKPKYLEPNSKLPIVIFCRGGNRNLDILKTFHLQMINELASNGFVALASQLRGNSTSEGQDEFGGEDLNDILKLIEIAENLDFADENNIGVLGYSRGGMNTYQLAAKSSKIKAIATVGAPTNLFELTKFRPNMYNYVFKPLFGDTISNKNEFIKRSAIYWHKKIKQPTLILHGKEDNRVSIKEAQQLVDSFKVNKKPNFKHRFFSGGNHSLSNLKKERNELIVNWFNTHLK